MNHVQQLSELSKPNPITKPTPAQREGPLARAIEQQTAKLPSDLFLWTAIGAMGLSLVYELSGKKKEGNFIAHWVPSLLIFGVYNKLVKLNGSDGA